MHAGRDNRPRLPHTCQTAPDCLLPHFTVTADFSVKSSLVSDGTFTCGPRVTACTPAPVAAPAPAPMAAPFPPPAMAPMSPPNTAPPPTVSAVRLPREAP